MTTGEKFTAAVRQSFRIGPRTKDYRDGGSIKGDVLESIAIAIHYPGYYDEERTALSKAAFSTYSSHKKHIDGFRVSGAIHYRIMTMSPWEFTALLGEMIDAGVTNVGEGERFYRNMSRVAA